MMAVTFGRGDLLKEFLKIQTRMDVNLLDWTHTNRTSNSVFFDPTYFS